MQQFLFDKKEEDKINESINTSPSSSSKAEYDDEELSYQKNYYYKYKEKNFGNIFYNNNN